MANANLRLPVVAALLLLLSWAALSQVDTGAIFGTITDPSGGVIIGACFCRAFTVASGRVEEE